MKFLSHTHDLEDIATRLNDLLPPWEKEENAQEETIEALEDDPVAIVEYLLEWVEELYTK